MDDKISKILTLEERKKRLSKIASDDADMPAAIRALDTLNKMESVYVTKIEDITNYKGLPDAALLTEVIVELLKDAEVRKQLRVKLKEFEDEDREDDTIEVEFFPASTGGRASSDASGAGVAYKSLPAASKEPEDG